MKKPSEYVRVPRADAERMLRELRQIATADKHPDYGYAGALGACNGAAKMLIIDLEAYLNA